VATGCGNEFKIDSEAPHAGPFDHLVTLPNVSVEPAVASDDNLHPRSRCLRRLPVFREARKSDQSY
jgi:hypothetical protein